MSLKMMYWREAATLIFATKNVGVSSLQRGTRVIEPDKRNSGRTDVDYKILMLKRSGSSSFMPSRMVFPGGTLSDIDHSKVWCDLFNRFTGRPSEDLARNCRVNGPRPPMISVNRPLWEGIGADVAFRICAIRETFEESGILVVLSKEELLQLPNIKSRNLSTLKRWNESEKLQLERWRRLVIKDASAFAQMCVELEVFPNIWALSEWSNWLTPVFAKVEEPTKKPMRFDTMFYICCFECDGLPMTSVDDAETVLFQWKRPLEYLSSDVMLDAPQGYELMRMLHFQSLTQLNQFCVDRGTKGLQRYMPVVQFCDDGVVSFLPGDSNYPENPDYEGSKVGPTSVPQTILELHDESKPMHRLIFQQSGGHSACVCNRPHPYGHVNPLEFRPSTRKAADTLPSKI